MDYKVHSSSAYTVFSYLYTKPHTKVLVTPLPLCLAFHHMALAPQICFAGSALVDLLWTLAVSPRLVDSNNMHATTGVVGFCLYSQEEDFVHSDDIDLYRGFLRVADGLGILQPYRLSVRIEAYRRFTIVSPLGFTYLEYVPRDLAWLRWSARHFFKAEVEALVVLHSTVDDDWLEWSFYIACCESISYNIKFEHASFDTWG
jgi:hypothetical protein